MKPDQYQTVHQTATNALQYLAETDEDCARAKSLMEGLHHKLKRVLAIEKLKANGKSMAENTTIAEASKAYEEVCESHQNAVLDYEILRNKRNTAQAQFEWARSMNANRRQGGGNL